VKTDVPAERLAALNQALADLPETFHLHPRLERIRQRRPQISPVGDALIDWITAEELALASILEEGIPVRLTGQDVERGTFSHRHAVLHDAQTGERFIPLHHLSQVRAAFEIHNSPLSEYAALGFEFGYNVQAPERLVIWEAQYGDFINNAQTIVDEFLTSGRDKWGLLPSLVLLLPHGYEGQGPDHSSGRLERFLGLAADKNLRVANCTTAANYFHLLRRQALLLTVDPLPLVVMTPKSLLRHPLVHSPLREFTEAGWQPVIDRPLAGQPEEPGEVRQALLCSGKLYVDLVSSELAIEHPDTRIVRLEQLAPFPTEAVKKVLERYPNLMELTWVQEEPLNMGAAGFVQPYLEELCEQYRPGGLPFRVVARPVSSSPAEGSSALHLYRQRKLIEEAFTAGSQPDRLENGEHPREDTGTRSGESQKEEKGRA
jgi:2-oxoglutarate dehydrogenase E1 component